MFDRMLDRDNISGPNQSDDKPTEVEKYTAEFKEVQFHFRSMFSMTNNPGEDNIYDIDKAYSLKNKFVNINWEKRARTQETSYGWFSQEALEEKKFDELIKTIRAKGYPNPNVIDLTVQEIFVIPHEGIQESNKSIFLCRFIIGSCIINIKNDNDGKNNPNDRNDDEKEDYDNEENYDAVCNVSGSDVQSYIIRKLENIQLLYLLKPKDGEQKANPNICSDHQKYNQNYKGGSFIPDSYYICSLDAESSDNKYYCTDCHKLKHQDTQTDMSHCVLQRNSNDGYCQNIHSGGKDSNNQAFKVEFYCEDCNKGFCAVCLFNGREKHERFQRITEVYEKYKNEAYEDLASKEKEINRPNLAMLISETKKQVSKDFGDTRREINNKFTNSYKSLDNGLLTEGANVFNASCQLNFIKDSLDKFNALYKKREDALRASNDNGINYPELIWSKKVHIEHLLHWINHKKSVDRKLDEKVHEEEHINAFKSDITNEIRKVFPEFNVFGEEKFEEVKIEDLEKYAYTEINK
ncbi:MAG: hypothetical protein MJ252_28980 [archaeon]|nr:hypothetical protein [archaeon]